MIELTVPVCAESLAASVGVENENVKIRSKLSNFQKEFP